jgi:hypothetical protein
VIDGAYRLLAVLVQLRFQIALVLGVVNAVFLLVEVSQQLDVPSLTGVLSLFDSPLILGLAVWLLAQLPPGVVFRRVAAGRVGVRSNGHAAADRMPTGCRVSGWFRVAEAWEWRLLVPSTLKLNPWGGVELFAARPAEGERSLRLGSRSAGMLDWYRPVGPRPPIWAADPSVIQRLLTAQSRRERPPEPSERLAIAAQAVRDVATGWQYAGLRRYAALRIAHRGVDRTERLTYLAFDSAEARDALRARFS